MCVTDKLCLPVRSLLSLQNKMCKLQPRQASSSIQQVSSASSFQVYASVHSCVPVHAYEVQMYVHNVLD